MTYSVYLRSLKLVDAKTSYLWRNNPLIWQFTRFKPVKPISESMETEWLKKALSNTKEYRFAICLKSNGQYLGNVQLIDVKSKNAELHLFIGNPSFWGKGIGRQATALILNYGFTYLGLDSIRLDVHKDNYPAIALYNKLGFFVNGEEKDFIHMVIHSEDKPELQKIITQNISMLQ
jgi:diamine N-acetyltransferase